MFNRESSSWLNSFVFATGSVSQFKINNAALFPFDFPPTRPSLVALEAEIIFSGSSDLVKWGVF